MKEMADENFGRHNEQPEPARVSWRGPHPPSVRLLTTRSSVVPYDPAWAALVTQRRQEDRPILNVAGDVLRSWVHSDVGLAVLALPGVAVPLLRTRRHRPSRYLVPSRPPASCI